MWEGMWWGSQQTAGFTNMHTDVTFETDQKVVSVLFSGLQNKRSVNIQVVSAFIYRTSVRCFPQEAGSYFKRKQTVNMDSSSWAIHFNACPFLKGNILASNIEDSKGCKLHNRPHPGL